MLEKRKYTRLNQNLSISYQILDNPKENSSYSKDISECGICFPSIQKISLDTFLQIKVNLQETPAPLIFTGKVKRIIERNSSNFPFEIGIRFIKADVSSLKTLKLHIQQASTKKKNENIKWIKNI